jgi:Sulphur transport
MELVVDSWVFMLGALAAGVMGFAIQRGATCAVAAVDELVSKRSATRLMAMLEASLWVAVGLVLAQQLRWLERLPAGYVLSAWTIAGGALLGLGAWVNRACVFGAIARLGSGNLAYLATPLGYYLGCLTVANVFHTRAPTVVSSGAEMQIAVIVLAMPLVGLTVWRLYRFFSLKQKSQFATVIGLARAALWSPHGSTIIIGMMFLATIVLVGAWAYTDVLAELARGTAANLPARALMAVALLVGAMVGGYTAGRLRWEGLSLVALLRCLLGGVLMAWGSLLIPGSNDGLILIGMPLLWPYAWAAFFTMCLVVALLKISASRMSAALA